jgi:hypothetical protein
MSAHRLNSVKILDWYDGIVLALARTNWQPGTVLISLVTWVPGERKRVFALVPVTEEQATALAATEDWANLQQHLQTLAAQVSGDILLVRLDPEENEVVGETTVAVKDIQKDLFGEIESSLTPERRRWSDLL